MIEWYKSKALSICFDDIPQVGIRYVTPSMTEQEKKSVKKYPFVCKKELKVELTDYKKSKIYNFVIPKGYCYDGASIPRFFWRVTGSNTDAGFLIPSLIHDVLCENHNYINNDRLFSTEVFNALLEVSKVNGFKIFCMKNSVNCFQKLFCKWNVR